MTAAPEANVPRPARRRSVWHWVPLVAGAFLLFGPLFPRGTGYAAIEEAMGGPAALNRFFLGFAFLFLGGVIADKNRLVTTLGGIMEVVNRQLYGPSYKEDRALVTGLIRTLASPEGEKRAGALAALRKVTGQDFGEDAAVWAKWWLSARSTFRPVKAGEARARGDRG